jgi:hypothetical protein
LTNDELLLFGERLSSRNNPGNRGWKAAPTSQKKLPLQDHKVFFSVKLAV